MMPPKLPAFFDERHIDIDMFKAICSQRTNMADFPYADAVDHNVLIYDGDRFRRALNDPQLEATLRAELCRALKDGPGVLVVRNAYVDPLVIDRSTKIFREIVSDERAAGHGQGDHFGHNERI